MAWILGSLSDFMVLMKPHETTIFNQTLNRDFNYILLIFMFYLKISLQNTHFCTHFGVGLLS